MSSSYEEPPPLTLSNKTKKYNSKAAEALAAAQYTSHHQRDRRSDNDEIYSRGGNRISVPLPPPPPPPGKPERSRRSSRSSTGNLPSGFSEDPSIGMEGDVSLGSGSAAERRRRRAQEVAKQAEMKFSLQFSQSDVSDEKNIVDEDPPLKLDLSDSEGDSSTDGNNELKSKKKKGFLKNLIRKSNKSKEKSESAPKKGFFRGSSPGRWRNESTSNDNNGSVSNSKGAQRSAEIVVNRSKIHENERKLNEAIAKEESKSESKFEKLRREREEKRAEDERLRKERSIADSIENSDVEILKSESDEVSGVTDPSYNAYGMKYDKRKSNLESVPEISTRRSKYSEGAAAKSREIDSPIASTKQKSEWTPEDFKSTINAYSQDVFDNPFYPVETENQAPIQTYSFAYSESDGEFEKNIITSKDTMNGLSFDCTDDENDFQISKNDSMPRKARDAFLGFDESSGAVTVNANNMKHSMYQDKANDGTLGKNGTLRKNKGNITEDNGFTSKKVAPRSPSKDLMSSTSPSRADLHKTPSFIHERRQRRHRVESPEKKGDYSRVAYDLVRGKSDVNVASERGRRRDKLFDTVAEKVPGSPSGRSFSPSKVRRSLIDEPVPVLSSSAIRSQSKSEPKLFKRYDSRTANSWFSKPQFTYRPIVTLAKTTPGSVKRTNSFKAPEIYTSGTAGPFKAPKQFSMKSDPVLRSVAHIQDPIQRAGAMILSAAAIPIQTEIRRYLGVKHREDRFWAIIVVQSYFRRWKAELYRYKYLYCATRIQAAFRGWLCRDTLEDKHYCATLIQKVARGYLATMQVYEDLYNITVVQSLVRRNLAIKAAEDRYRNIIRIQSLWRAKQVRVEMEYIKWSAVKIQTAFRRYTAKLNYQFTIVDVIIVQSIVRRKAAQKKVEQLRAQRIQDSATTIQKYWRCYDCTMNYLHTVADILIVQSVVRRWLSKRYVVRYRCIREQEMAAKIQLACRMWISRVRVRKMRAARDIQKVWRGYLAYTNMLFSLVHIIICQSVVRRHLQLKRYKVDIVRHRSAIKLQRCARVFLIKRDFMYNYCATVIQTEVRRVFAKDLAEKMRAARTIQAWYRCQSTSRGYNYYISARKIQTIWRGYDARKLLDEERWVREYAATSIQKTWRMFYHYSNYEIYKIENSAATDIQKAWRGFWDYSQYVIMRYEATKIQSAARGMLARKNLARREDAAVVLQSAARLLLAKKLYHMERLYLVVIHGAQDALTQNIAARKIQTAFRSVYQQSKEKRAALIIERFFIWVRAEVEREIERRERQLTRKKQKQQLTNTVIIDDEGQLLEGSSVNKANDSPDHQMNGTSRERA